MILKYKNKLVLLCFSGGGRQLWKPHLHSPKHGHLSLGGSQGGPRTALFPGSVLGQNETTVPIHFIVYF
jgi:hypothetical protein